MLLKMRTPFKTKHKNLRNFSAYTQAFQLSFEGIEGMLCKLGAMLYGSLIEFDTNGCNQQILRKSPSI